jgi:hypothetical protein
MHDWLPISGLQVLVTAVTRLVSKPFARTDYPLHACESWLKRLPSNISSLTTVTSHLSEGSVVRGRREGGNEEGRQARDGGREVESCTTVGYRLYEAVYTCNNPDSPLSLLSSLLTSSILGKLNLRTTEPSYKWTGTLTTYIPSEPYLKEISTCVITYHEDQPM